MADTVTSQTIQDDNRKAVLKFTNISDGTGESAVILSLPNNAGSGKTGDIQFTTIGASSGDTYTVILEVIKSY
jgi:hypothetical protein